MREEERVRDGCAVLAERLPWSSVGKIRSRVWHSLGLWCLVEAWKEAARRQADIRIGRPEKRSQVF